MILSFDPPSRAEWALCLSYVGLALAGAVMGMEALGEINVMAPFTGHQVAKGWLAMSGAIGACLSARALQSRFTGAGWSGLRQAIVGAGIAAFLMSILAGTLVLPILGTMFGPWLVALSVWKAPWIAMPWICAFWGYASALKSRISERQALDHWFYRTQA